MWLFRHAVNVAPLLGGPSKDRGTDLVIDGSWNKMPTLKQKCGSIDMW